VKSITNHISTYYLRRLKHELRIFRHGVEPPKVSFLVCGTQKAGTTTLDEYLRQHPQICMAKFKEVHYFDRRKYFLYQHPDYRVYHDFFEPETNQQIWGETTPVYMYWYSAPRRIWEYNSEMKLIIILRNPIKRAYSHWNMQRERGVETLSFLEAIAEEERRRRESLPYQNRRFSYLDRGFYTDQIKRVRNYFPANQILLLKSETFKKDPKRILDLITNFLEIAEIDNFIELNLHSQTYSTHLDQKTHKILLDLYQYEIKEVEKLTGWDCSDWLDQQA
jgi:hypothetical protein